MNNNKNKLMNFRNKKKNSKKLLIFSNKIYKILKIKKLLLKMN